MKSCLAPMVLSLLFLTGCASNLQPGYVEAMEAYELALEADVKAGNYKMDKLSKDSFKAFKQANDDARAALPKEDK